jgi:hypothetical protein
VRGQFLKCDSWHNYGSLSDFFRVVEDALSRDFTGGNLEAQKKQKFDVQEVVREITDFIRADKQFH